MSIDSLRFSETIHRWYLDIIARDTTFSQEYLFGRLEWPTQPPFLVLSPDDTVRIKLIAVDRCVICGGLSGEGGASAIGDTLSIYSDEMGGLAGMVLIDFSLLVSIEEEPKVSSSSILVYPNPAANTVNIEALMPYTDTYQVCIYDSIGRLIYRKDVSLVTGSRWSMSWPESKMSFPGGVYFVRLSNRGSSITGSFIFSR